MAATRSRAQHRLGPKRDPAVDAAVLGAARELLVEVGYAGTTVDGIARRAGVSRPAIYRRWPSKALLVHEAVFPHGAVEPPVPRPFADEIAQLVRGTLAVFASPPARAAIPGLMMEMRNDPSLQEVFAARLEHEARRHFADDVLAPAADDGEARTGLDADVVFDALTGAVLYAICVRGIDDLGALAASLTDVLLRGCLPRI